MSLGEVFYALTHPASCLARTIENILISGRNDKNIFERITIEVTSRSLGLCAFPIILGLELATNRIPKMLWSIGQGNFEKKLDKVKKYVWSILFSPFALIEADATSAFFLKNLPSNQLIKPFGVEDIFGKEVSSIHYPETIEQVRCLVRKAKQDGAQVSVIGAGMSQGSQTVPSQSLHCVINTQKLNKVTFLNGNNSVKVQSGATWEQVQIEADKRGKSVLVKQASDIFSIGGSIGINCHGWAHEFGAIGSTVDSMEIIDANGELQTLTPKDELFKCMFGTLGYFGVIVSVTFRLTDNVKVIQKCDEISVDDFDTYYRENIKGKNIPLFGGRLVLDNLNGNPLRKVCMVRYENESVEPVISENFELEPKFGRRIERVAMQLISRLSYFSARRLLSWFWEKERAAMLKETRLTRNEALHPPINVFKMLHNSNLHTQWLQEYFVKPENLPNFLRYLGAELKANEVRLINATIRPVPKDTVSILPYAEQDRYAVVICFEQQKIDTEIEKTKHWIENVNRFLISQGDVYYQAYMPFPTREQFENSYGKANVNRLRKLKRKYDPKNLFGNVHAEKYFK